jgi:hypothetical protein
VSKAIRVGLGLLIGGVSLYLAVRQVNWGDVGEAFDQAKWGWVSLAVVSVLVNTLIKIIRWKLLSKPKGKPAGFGRLAAAFLTGQLLNSLYPGRVGDLGRTYISGENGTDRAFMLGTIALEKVFDLIALALLSIGLVLFTPVPRWIDLSVVGLVITGLAIVLVMGVAWGMRKRGEQMPGWLNRGVERLEQGKISGKVMQWGRVGFDSLNVLDKPLLLIGVIGCTILVWATALLTNLLVMQSLDSGLDSFREMVQAGVVILVGLIAGITIPSPGRIGVFEYICVLSLELFGVPQAIGLSYGLLLHSVVFVPQMVGGLVSMVAMGTAGGK